MAAPLSERLTKEHWDSTLDIASLIKYVLDRRQDGTAPGPHSVAKLRELLREAGREFLALAGEGEAA